MRSSCMRAWCPAWRWRRRTPQACTLTLTLALTLTLTLTGVALEAQDPAGMYTMRNLV